MKINKNTQINGEKVILVPYERKHVFKYHDWMKSEELQMLTASEPLTLVQEYEMQESWRNDENSESFYMTYQWGYRTFRKVLKVLTLVRLHQSTKKCTFIVLDKRMSEMGNHSEIDCMVGDVNLFFNEKDNNKSAEVEIMIAETTARGRGLGEESLYSMMRYGFENLSVETYTAKIQYNNSKSLKLFEKIGFYEVSRSDVFQEVTLRLDLCVSRKDAIVTATRSYKIVPYTDNDSYMDC